MTDEANYLEIHSVMLYLEDARRRAERAIATLREEEAEEHLIEALERTEEELSEVARKLRQGTFFAVPKAQLSF
jgi:HEAT repeat protein